MRWSAVTSTIVIYSLIGTPSKKVRRSVFFIVKNSYPNQRDQIGRFFTVLGTIFLVKVAKIFGDLKGYFERHHF